MGLFSQSKEYVKIDYNEEFNKYIKSQYYIKRLYTFVDAGINQKAFVITNDDKIVYVDLKYKEYINTIEICVDDILKSEIIVETIQKQREKMFTLTSTYIKKESIVSIEFKIITLDGIKRIPISTWHTQEQMDILEIIDTYINKKIK